MVGERFTGIFAVFRFWTGSKGEFDRARNSRDLGLLWRRGLVLSTGDFSTKEPLHLRFVKSPGETKRVGCERVRGSLSFHHFFFNCFISKTGTMYTMRINKKKITSKLDYQLLHGKFMVS